MADAIQVTVWNEYRHEKTDERIAQLYPEGMHGAIAELFSRLDLVTGGLVTGKITNHQSRG